MARRLRLRDDAGFGVGAFGEGLRRGEAEDTDVVDGDLEKHCGDGEEDNDVGDADFGVGDGTRTLIGVGECDIAASKNAYCNRRHSIILGLDTHIRAHPAGTAS